MCGTNTFKEVPELEIFNFIKDDFIEEGDGQVVSGSESLPDPVTLETEDQNLEREKDEHDVLEALGVTRTTSVTLKCLSRMCLWLLT